jgi:acyl dehydratase
MSTYNENKEIKLEAGHEFPPVYYTLDKSTVRAYLEAVEETSELYQNTDLVPPTAIAALSMAALAEGTPFPPGCIHTSQKLNFKHSTHIGDIIQCHSRIRQSKKRAGMHFITVTFHVEDQNKRELLSGETVFIAPQDA